MTVDLTIEKFLKLLKTFVVWFFCNEQNQVRKVEAIVPGEVYITKDQSGRAEIWVVASSKKRSEQMQAFVYCIRLSFFHNELQHIPETRFLQAMGMLSANPGAYPAQNRTYKVRWGFSPKWLEKMILEAKNQYASMISGTTILHKEGSPFV